MKKKRVGKPRGRPKTGGRQKGTPNKITTDARDWINDIINRNRGQIEEDLQALEPKDRIAAIERFMNYVIPKQGSVQARIDVNQLSEKDLDFIIDEISKSIDE